MDRIAALERKVELDTVNRHVEPDQLAKENNDEEQRGPKTITEDDDRFTRHHHELRLIVAKINKDLDSSKRRQASTERLIEKLYAEIMPGNEQNGIEETMKHTNFVDPALAGVNPADIIPLSSEKFIFDASTRSEDRSNFEALAIILPTEQYQKN